MRKMNTVYTLQLLSYKFARCQYCGDEIHDKDDGDISYAINHYIGHGMNVLHVGQLSYEGRDGEMVHGATAILGTDTKPNK